MPANNFDFYMHEARNNFDAMRPVPVCVDASQAVGQCQQKIHISTNCYYGYHGSNNSGNQIDADYEMSESPPSTSSMHQQSTAYTQCQSRKRPAEEDSYPQTKKVREDEPSIWSLVGTRSRPSHSASAYTSKEFLLIFKFIIIFFNIVM